MSPRDYSWFNYCLCRQFECYSKRYVSSSVPQERIENLIKSKYTPNVNLASKVKEG